MSDPEITPVTETVTDEDTTLSQPPMEAPPQPQTQPTPSTTTTTTTTTTKPSAISFSIWPPTQRTRDAVINRLIETLSTPSSVLSKRYGTLSSDDASSVARQIEDEAFAAAGSSASADDDGIEILQTYSKEISKRMLDTVKSKAPAASAADNGGASDVTSLPAGDDVVADAVSDS